MKKSILVGTCIFSCFLMVMVPQINAVQYQNVVEVNKEQIESIKEKTLLGTTNLREIILDILLYILGVLTPWRNIILDLSEQVGGVIGYFIRLCALVPMTLYYMVLFPALILYGGYNIIWTFLSLLSSWLEEVAIILFPNVITNEKENNPWSYLSSIHDAISPTYFSS